ncbi:AMP-binding-domain-containing protein [Fistulina hepatica ATCC 64428]|uniref:AMP-binding-domain-containing protein n=1 Tax=Fistulina hepatica ATCC 64428 TaxID=1128425 RepID=A0A0D7A6Z2_9AGAR|nr:AMP-binding-domain-containing protein [Fistulina hepatica ATCC 64428]
MAIFILDEWKRPVPPGVVGSIYIGSLGLSRGYTDARLNQGTFLDCEDVFGKDADVDADVRLFRSSDQARWSCTTGCLDFVGRNDSEAKIRGQRIDLDGIDSALRHDSRVEDAATVIQTDLRGQQYLVSFVIPERCDSETRDRLPAMLRNALCETLPSYMVPSYMVLLDKFPTTNTGKIDRRTLGTWRPYEKNDETPTELPDGATNTERVILQVFREVLHRREDVNLTTSFFDLGGHSLLATQAISRIRKILGIDVQLSVRALFDAPTPSVLASFIDRLDTGVDKGYIPIPHRLRAINELSRLSFAQERLYFLEMLHPEEAAYIIPFVFRLVGDLDLDALRDAFNDLRCRHDILQVTYEEIGGVPMQRVHPCIPQALPLEDLTGHPESFSEHIKEELRRPFDLHAELPIRYKVYKLRDNEHVLCVCLHHLATDAWSDAILERELGLLYTAHRTGVPPSLPSLPITYFDFVVWQRDPAYSALHDAQLEHWVSVLKGSTAAEFPTDFRRPEVLSPRAGLERICILDEDVRALEHFASRFNATPFIVLLSVLRLLHYRLTGIEDAAIGNPIAGRNHIEVEPLVGFFVNTMAQRIVLDGGLRFAELCESVRRVAIAAYDAQDVAFERIVHELHPVRDLSRMPIVQIMIAVHPDEDVAFGYHEKGRLTVETVDVEPVTRFDMELHFVKARHGRGYEGKLLYSRDLYLESSAVRFVAQFLGLLRQATREVNGYDTVLDEFVLPGALESLERLDLLTDNSKPFPSSEGLGVLFKRSAVQHSHRVAVRDSLVSYTYESLDVVSDTIADRLSTLAIPDESLVGLLCPRSASYIACILGIIKAGLAYLPLDPQLPRQRLETLLEDIPSSSYVICDASLRSMLGDRVKWLAIDDLTAPPHTGTYDIRGSANGQSLAYVMYTSGSTGRPKAVLIEHHSIARLAFDRTVLDPRPGQIWAHISNAAFDSSTWEIWTPLLNGGTVICFDRMTVLDFHLLSRAFKEYSVDVAFLTTALMAKCLKEAPSLLQTLDILAMGGEMCDPRDVSAASLLVRGYVAHVYGPTESTTYATVYHVPRGHLFSGPVPIGRPLSNTTAYVLDNRRRLVPAGVVGELYLGGAGLARGYGDVEQTILAFVDVEINGVWKRLYRTGDRARWRSNDGQLEFLGRRDHQIKLRGQRIELG